MMKHVVVAGAGLGGLATALRLAKSGYSVEIVEKNSQPGGRLNQLKKDGFTFDTGPSFFSMSYEFKQFASDCGIELPFRFVELDPLYTVNFSNSPKTWYLYKDIRKLAAQFDEVEPGFEEKMTRYLDKCGRIFHDTVGIVIKQNFDSLLDFGLALIRVNPVHLPVLFRKFNQQVNHYFTSNEARRIISLVAFFLGRTPFDTSSVYTLLSYTEFMHDGYYNVEGGMYAIIEGLVREFEKAGGKITCNTEIKGFRGSNRRLEAFIDQNGKEWKGDIFLANADAAVFRGTVMQRKAFSPEKLDRMEWTMGYMTIYVGIRGKLPHVNHHNYFLGDNFEDYARDVQKNPDTLQKPYYYVNVISRHNDSCAPEGCESLFFVCPVPDLRTKPDWSDKEEIAMSIINDFGKRIGQDIVPDILTKTIYTPLDWQEQFNLHRGSGLGLSHKITQIGAFRPKNFDEKFSNLFYVGASTHPGAGLPMAIISSNLVYERISSSPARYPFLPAVFRPWR